ncbi:dnajc4 family protein [Megaselia abdita]
MKSPNYYEILNINENASSDEIRSAFLRLSKKFHPDKVGQFSNKSTTDKYVKINEAYQVLSKHTSRTAYDFNLSEATRLHTTGKPPNVQYYQSWNAQRPNASTSTAPPFGVKWIPRVSNMKLTVALICLGISGGIFGFFSVQKLFSKRQEYMDEVSRQASQHHASCREQAKKLGNDGQLQRIAEKILTNRTQ